MSLSSPAIGDPSELTAEEIWARTLHFLQAIVEQANLAVLKAEFVAYRWQNTRAYR